MEQIDLIYAIRTLQEKLVDLYSNLNFIPKGEIENYYNNKLAPIHKAINILVSHEPPTNRVTDKG